MVTKRIKTPKDEVEEFTEMMRNFTERPDLYVNPGDLFPLILDKHYNNPPSLFKSSRQEVLMNALKSNGGDMERAARHLGISRRELKKEIQRIKEKHTRSHHNHSTTSTNIGDKSNSPPTDSEIPKQHTFSKDILHIVILCLLIMGIFAVRQCIQ